MKLHGHKRNIVIWTVIITVLVLSFLSILSTNKKLQDQAAQATIQRDCTQEFLAQTVEVLNERTQSSPELNEADQTRVMAEGKLFGFIVKTQGTSQPAPQELIDKFNALTTQYFRSIQRYLTILGRTNINQVVNPFPTKEQYHTCLASGK